MNALGSFSGTANSFHHRKSLQDQMRNHHPTILHKRLDRVEEKVDRIENKIDRIDRRQITVGKVFLSLVIGKAIRYWWNE